MSSKAEDALGKIKIETEQGIDISENKRRGQIISFEIRYYNDRERQQKVFMAVLADAPESIEPDTAIGYGETPMGAIKEWVDGYLAQSFRQDLKDV